MISLRALCIGRRQARESDEIQVNAAKFAQIDLVDSLQNKVCDQTKRHTILVSCGMLVATTAEIKAHVIFLVRMINFRDNRTIPLIRRYVHKHWNTTYFIHAILGVILKGSVVILYRVTIQKHFPDRTKEVRITRAIYCMTY